MKVRSAETGNNRRHEIIDSRRFTADRVNMIHLSRRPFDSLCQDCHVEFTMKVSRVVASLLYDATNDARSLAEFPAGIFACIMSVWLGRLTKMIEWL